jgi:hypothetical protein
MIIVINRRALKIFSGMLLHSIGCSAVAFAIATGPNFDLATEFGIICVSLVLYLIAVKFGSRIASTHGGPLASLSINTVSCAMMTTIMVVYGTGWIPLVAAAFYCYLAVQYFRLAIQFVLAARKRS